MKLTVLTDNHTFIDQYYLGEPALCFLIETDGLYILTGCSHSGICNIIAYAKTLFPDRPVLGVIGGFHLFHCDQRLQDTISYFQAQNLQHLYPCHCVSFQAKAEMHRVIPVQETGVGLQLNW